MKKTILLLMLSCIFSCNQTQKKGIDIEALIEENSEQRLFLSFWAGMSSYELRKVKSYENEKGNLDNGKFIIKFPESYPYNFSSSNLISIPFSISKKGEGIQLAFENEDWVDVAHISILNEKGIEKGNYYTKVKNYIVDQYNLKYTQIVNKENHLVWKTDKNNIIILNYYIYYFKIAEGNQATFMPQKIKDKYSIAKLKIQLEYYTLEEYQKIIIATEIDEIKKEIMRLTEEERKKKELEDNIENL